MNGNDFGSNVGGLDAKRIFIVIGIVAFIAFVVGFALAGCSTTDREMMELEGDYDCVVMQDGRAFCK